MLTKVKIALWGLEIMSFFTEGGGCGRFWNLPIFEICSLHKETFEDHFLHSER